MLRTVSPTYEHSVYTENSAIITANKCADCVQMATSEYNSAVILNVYSSHYSISDYYLACDSIVYYPNSFFLSKQSKYRERVEEDLAEDVGSEYMALEIVGHFFCYS